MPLSWPSLKFAETKEEMGDQPVRREQQFMEIVNAIEYQEHIIIVSGPISSGKTFTVTSVIERFRDPERMLTAHVFCDTENIIADVLTDAIAQLTSQEQ
jgi:excinuclease UvrABC helicase subunit UvrB